MSIGGGEEPILETLRQWVVTKTRSTFQYSHFDVCEMGGVAVVGAAGFEEIAYDAIVPALLEIGWTAGDHILAARFLNRFVPNNIAWLHLDLAAGARTGGLAHIATEITGFGVRYTLDLLRRGWPPVSQRPQRTAGNRPPARTQVRRAARGAPAKRRLPRAS